MVAIDRVRLMELWVLAFGDGTTDGFVFHFTGLIDGHVAGTAVTDSSLFTIKLT
jgi:hypothetical protein